MALNKAIATVGIAKQVDQATAAANPTFLHGVRGGTVRDAQIDQAAEERTSVYREQLAVNRTKVAFGQSFTAPVLPKSIGLWQLGLMGSVVTTGSGPYTHTFSVASTMPWVTLFSQFGGSNFIAMPASKIDSMKFAWKGTEPLDVEAVGVCIGAPTFPGSLTPGTDDSLAAGFVPVGGTFKLDVDGTTLADEVITEGDVELSNNLEAIYGSSSVSPLGIDEKAFDAKVSLSVMATDLAAWRTIATGTPTGTAVSQVPVFGSFETKFVAGAASLTLRSLKIPFLCDFPDADPKGGTPIIKLTGDPIKPNLSTPALEVVLINDVVSY